jgi:hypothetical protein
MAMSMAWKTKAGGGGILTPSQAPHGRQPASIPRKGDQHERAIIFGLLLVLMLTGMPISISLGLTVLTFLFTMTEVPSNRWP